MKMSSDHDRTEGALPQMPKFGMRWYQYNPAYHMAATLKASAQEKADYYDALNMALIMGTRGNNPEADRMLDNADHVSSVRSKVARDRHETERKGANAMQLQSKSNALPTDRPDLPTGPDLKTDQIRSDREQPRVGNLGFQIGKIMEAGNGQDRYERIAALGHGELADFAANFCGEAGKPQTIAKFKSIMNIIGPEAFRSELTSFCGDIDAGEEPRNRGAALTSRLNKLADAKRSKA